MHRRLSLWTANFILICFDTSTGCIRSAARVCHFFVYEDRSMYNHFKIKQTILLTFYFSIWSADNILRFPIKWTEPQIIRSIVSLKSVLPPFLFRRLTLTPPLRNHGFPVWAFAFAIQTTCRKQYFNCALKVPRANQVSYYAGTSGYIRDAYRATNCCPGIF